MKTLISEILDLKTIRSQIIATVLALLALAAEGLILVSMLTGCSDAPKTMEYYKEHAEEARSVVAECKTTQSDTEDCTNASAALFRIGGKKPIRGNEPHLKTW